MTETTTATQPVLDDFAAIWHAQMSASGKVMARDDHHNEKPKELLGLVTRTKRSNLVCGVVKDCDNQTINVLRIDNGELVITTVAVSVLEEKATEDAAGQLNRGLDRFCELSKQSRENYPIWVNAVDLDHMLKLKPDEIQAMMATPLVWA